MSWFKDYKLVQNGDECIVEIYLNPDDTEFSKEFFTNIKENVLDLDDQVKKLVKDNFSDIKVTTVKLVLGAMVVATIPFVSDTKVKALDTSSISQQQQIAQTYSITPLNSTGTVTASALNVRTGPATSYGIMYKLYLGNKVQVIGEANGWYKIRNMSDASIGWVSKVYLTLTVPTRQEKINTVVAVSKYLLGTPYVWGGESLEEGGFDCSGLTYYVYKQVGVNLNRVSAEQAKQGTTVSKDSLQPGDLVFYSLAGNGIVSHVGIYLGAGKMIHSPKAGDVVKITDITTSYWQSKYIIAKRMM